MEIDLDYLIALAMLCGVALIVVRIALKQLSRDVDGDERPALEEAARAIEQEADAYESQLPGNGATGPMYEAARIVRQFKEKSGS